MGFLKWFARVGSTGGIVRSQVACFRKYRRRRPTATEKEIANQLLADRFSLLLKPTGKESERIKQFQSEQASVDDMYDLCVTILEIETGLTVFDQPAYDIACEVIREELEKRGFSQRQV